MNGFKNRVIGRVRERSPLTLEPLESRILLSADNPFTAPVFTALAQPPQIVSGLGSWQQPIDADNNGFGDIVLSYGDGANPAATSHVAVMLGQADGHFTQQDVVVLSGEVKLVDVVDLNNDNKPDIVVHWERQSPTPQGFIDVYKNNGNGTFTHQGSPIPVAPDWSMDIVDMNGDGKQDLFVTNPGDDTVDVYLGNGNCTFQAAAETVFGAGKTITYHAQDVNNDSVLDILLNYSVGSPIPTGSNIEVHLGQSDGHYNTTASWSDTGTFSYVDGLQNLTGDSLPDLLIYRRSSFLPTSAATVLAFRNVGGGDFTQAWSKDLANGFSGDAQVVDLVGAGSKDLVLTDGLFGGGAQRTVYVEHNPGNAAFTDAQEFEVDNLLFAFTTASTDVDHDGRPDLVADLYASSGGVTTDWGVKIFFNDGAGTFLTGSPVLVQPPTAPSQFVGQVLDLNGDHLLDVVFMNRTTNVNNAITADQAETFMNSGGRTIGTEQVTDFGANTMADVIAMDFNGDGKVDAVPAFDVVYDQGTGDYTAGGFTFWRGTGTGTFIAAASPNTASGRIETTITDPGFFEVPADGNFDLLLMGGTPIGLYVALNTTSGGAGDVTAPTADLADPANGGTISLTTLNSRGTLDVTFSDAGGSGLKTSTITDAGQEFSLSGAGAAGVTVTGAPTLVGGTTYRYSFTGSFSAGPVNVNFTAGAWTDTAGNPNAAAAEGFSVTALDTTPPTVNLNLSDPAINSSIVAADLNSRRYIDVAFAEAGGSGLDASTVADSGQEFALTGAAAAGVTVDGAATLVSGTSSTYRYTFTGAFTTGHVDLNFYAGSFADNAGNPNAVQSEGFDVVASAAQVPIAQHTSDDGLVVVSIYDVVGPVDVNPANVKIAFKNDSVTSISLGGADPMEGLGIVISGATSVGAIKDSRTAPGPVAFIASDSAIGSLTLKSGTSGYNLNGLALGGLIFPPDIDGDGSASDATALFCTDAVTTVSLGGTASGDFWIGGADPKTLLSNKSFTVKNGGLEGDLVTEGAEGAVTLAGDFDSHLDIAGALTSLTIKGGDFGGTLFASGIVGKVAVSPMTVAGVPVGGGVTTGAAINITGTDPKTNLSLKSFSATGAITGLNMTLSGGLGALKGAGWSGGSLVAVSSGAITLTGDFATQMDLLGPLASLTIKGGNFSGHLSGQESVGAISISSQKVAGVTVGGGVTTGATLDVFGVDPKTTLSLKSFSATGAITGLNMTLSGGLGTLKGAGWSGGSLSADSSGAITLTGDFATQMNLFGPLASLTIKGGNFSGSLGNLGDEGPVGAISISSQKVAGVTVGGNITSGAVLNFDSADSKTNLALKSLTATGTVTGLNLTSSFGLGSITTGSWAGGGVNAPFLNKLMVKGDMTSAVIQLTDQDAKGNSLGYFGAVGWFQGSEIRTVANMDSVTVGGIRQSNVFAGIAPDVTGLPAFAGNFVAPAMISSFTIKGTVKQDGEFSMIGSNIAAHDFKTIVLAGINLDNGGVPFGVSSLHIASITVKDISGTFHASNLDLPSDSITKQDANILILMQIF